MEGADEGPQPVRQPRSGARDEDVVRDREDRPSRTARRPPHPGRAATSAAVV